MVLALPVSVEGQALPSLAPMLERVLPSVVNIATTGKVEVQQNPFMNDPLFREFFDTPRSQPRERQFNSLGSGVIIDSKKGYVITNSHVIENADEINVTLRDGRSFEAKLIGADPEADIAVIELPISDLVGIDIGDSDDLRVGDFVVAIGNPFGLGQTVTSGIVSAKGRSGLGIEGYEDFIQTDASINQGNSGGALVNLRGQLIGINTAILGGRGGGSVGIGFAIPANMALSLTSQIVEYGEVRRGQLGVIVQDLTLELANALGIEFVSGALISQVLPNSAAQEAGLEEGDVVISVNGRSTNGASSLRNVIGLARAGEVVEIQYLRDGETFLRKVKIRSIQTEVSLKERTDGFLAGVTLGEPSETNAGVVVLRVERETKAWSAGLRPQDLILSINRIKINKLEDVEKAIALNASGILLNIRRGNSALFIVIR
tara:strand:+ start:16688 stop:17983 length:1296 start_codon:yes stop_codon:yes gene_type:complete